MYKRQEYDVWSIIYGYKLIPDAKSAEEERATLNKWIKERAGNPVYRFGSQKRNTFDPTAQTEDLGSDAVQSGNLGIENLKRIVPKLIQWSEDAGEGNDYDQLAEMYGAVYGQMGKYLRHVVTNLGGVVQLSKTTEQKGPVFFPVSKESQMAAMKFLDNQIWQTPKWLLDNDILQKIAPSGATDRISSMQGQVLNQMFDAERLRLSLIHI